MADINYLSLDEIVATHFDQISRYGGVLGIRDLDLLLSAIEKPKVTFGGKFLYPSIFDKASVLLCSIIKNHPFIDGNKRTAVVCMARFLYINGYLIKASKKEFTKLLQDIAIGPINIKKVSTWAEKKSSHF